MPRASVSLRRRSADGVDRVRAAAFPIAQCALGAALAYQFATQVLGHQRPMFASVAAVVALGTRHTQRLRRVFELSVGVALGVMIGDLLIRQIGSGSWQIAVVVVLGMAVAQFLDGGSLITNQVCLQAIFVTVLPPPPGGNVTRWEDALVGGGIALLVAALLPADPRRDVRRQADLMINELSDVVADTARAIRLGEAAIADAALDRARSTQGDLDRWKEALLAGEEISRLSPLRRRRRGDMVRYRQALTGLDRATRNTRVAVRRVAAVLDAGGSVPPSFADLLDDLAHALRLIGAGLAYPQAGDFAVGPQGEATAALVRLAAELRFDHLSPTESLSLTVVIAQIRSVVVDLLGATGVDLADARAVLPEAFPRAG